MASAIFSEIADFIVRFYLFGTSLDEKAAELIQLRLQAM